MSGAVILNVLINVPLVLKLSKRIKDAQYAHAQHHFKSERPPVNSTIFTNINSRDRLYITSIIITLTMAKTATKDTYIIIKSHNITIIIIIMINHLINIITTPTTTIILHIQDNALFIFITTTEDILMLLMRNLRTPPIFTAVEKTHQVTITIMVTPDITNMVQCQWKDITKLNPIMVCKTMDHISIILSWMLLPLAIF